MTDHDDALFRTAKRPIAIGDRILALAEEVVKQEVSPSDVSARAYAEAECLRKISEELKD